MALHHDSGIKGEQIAYSYLIEKGYTIIARNFRRHRIGEIDLIAVKDRFAVCVEVKTRYAPTVPFEYLVPWSKQKKIIKTALYAISKLNLNRYIIRFDIVFVDLGTTPPSIRHIESAFTL
jgi:putative endonuclease